MGKPSGNRKAPESKIRMNFLHQVSGWVGLFLQDVYKSLDPFLVKDTDTVPEIGPKIPLIIAIVLF